MHQIVICANLAETVNEIKRPDYNEMADSPMLSARERKLRREARSVIPLKASVECMTLYPSCMKTEEVVEKTDEKLIDDEMTEDESLIWVPRGRDPSISERKVISFLIVFYSNVLKSVGQNMPS